jgi:predicted nucleic acid-binding protein
MNRIVVDTDVASYIFNWHSSAQRFVDALRGAQLILSFMSIAEMRMGAIAADWGARRRTLLEEFMGGSAWSTRTTPCAQAGREFALRLAPLAAR